MVPRKGGKWYFIKVGLMQRVGFRGRHNLYASLKIIKYGKNLPHFFDLPSSTHFSMLLRVPKTWILVTHSATSTDP